VGGGCAALPLETATLGIAAEAELTTAGVDFDDLLLDGC
jgi:hypothetical protein